MRLLLDTHVLVWAASAPRRLSERARDAIQDATNERLVSVLSIYEVLYKREASPDLSALPEDLRELTDPLLFSWLEVTDRHAETAARLPRLHRDPWDRIIVAQALNERLTLVTADDALSAYGAPILW
jgi:PIN domain nuclease of toxin-antitoxin system